jgi:hypothetical protein
MSCQLICCKPGESDEHGMLPGWGCCKCRVYNGLQRELCKSCGHNCCNEEKPLPEKFGLCNECGVPKGAAHIGHNPSYNAWEY